jgi:hypothetical protein
MEIIKDDLKVDCRYLINRLQYTVFGSSIVHNLTEIKIIEIAETAIKIKELNSNVFWFNKDWEINIIEKLSEQQDISFNCSETIEILKIYNKYMNIVVNDDRLMKLVNKIFHNSEHF